MNKQAVLHIPCSNYSFAKSENEVVLRIRTARDDDIKKISVVYGCKYDFTEKQSVKELEKRYSDKLFDFYETEIVLDDVRFVYVFYIESADGNYYFSEDGFTAEYNYSLGFYNFFQIPYINKADVHDIVPWMQEAVFYQIFVDRFKRGDFKKDNRYINLSWGEIPKQDSFAGGDLKGITEKLDYIRGLNANAIYLTPIFKSKSNHKYDISDYFTIDEHFGTESDFRTLVNSAHEKGMRIVLDAVFNHASEDLKQFQDVVKRGKGSEYFDWFIIDGDKIDKDSVNYEVFAHCSYMPKFNTSNPEVRKFLLDIACFWTKEYNIDGWRLDVSDEISHDFWRSFRKAVRKINPECVIIGENWHDAYPFLMGDQYDGIMNYSFTKACLDYFAFDAFDSVEFADRLNEILMRNTENVNNMMMNLLDSHDTHRFFTQINKDKAKLIAAIAIEVCFVGAPCVYYGTEIAIEGGYDPDCRRTFDWDEQSWDNDLMEKIKLLLGLKRNVVLQRGSVRISEESGLFMLKRSLEGKSVVLIYNPLAVPVKLDEIKSKFGFSGGNILFGNNISGNLIEEKGLVIFQVKED